jgi:hypothetical protein
MVMIPYFTPALELSGNPRNVTMKIHWQKTPSSTTKPRRPVLSLLFVIRQQVLSYGDGRETNAAYAAMRMRHTEIHWPTETSALASKRPYPNEPTMVGAYDQRAVVGARPQIVSSTCSRTFGSLICQCKDIFSLYQSTSLSFSDLRDRKVLTVDRMCELVICRPLAVRVSLSSRSRLSIIIFSRSLKKDIRSRDTGLLGNPGKRLRKIVPETIVRSPSI